MNLRLRKHNHETWEEMRVRLIAETSLFLTEALQHPELVIRIPMIPAGSGRFPPSLTRAFWEQVLVD